MIFLPIYPIIASAMSTANSSILTIALNRKILDPSRYSAPSTYDGCLLITSLLDCRLDRMSHWYLDFEN